MAVVAHRSGPVEILSYAGNPGALEEESRVAALRLELHLLVNGEAGGKGSSRWVTILINPCLESINLAVKCDSQWTHSSSADVCSDECLFKVKRLFHDSKATQKAVLTSYGSHCACISAFCSMVIRTTRCKHSTVYLSKMKIFNEEA